MGLFTDNDIEEYGLIKSNILRKCLMCINQTYYVEWCSEGRFCSSECHDKFYKEYVLFLKGVEKLEGKRFDIKRYPRPIKFPIRGRTKENI